MKEDLTNQNFEKNEAMAYEILLHSNKLCIDLVDSLFDPQAENIVRFPQLPHVLLGIASQYFFKLSSTMQIARDEYDTFVSTNVSTLKLKPQCNLRLNSDLLRGFFEGDEEILGTKFKLKNLGVTPTSTDIKKLLGPLFKELYTTFHTEYLNSSVKTNIKQHIIDMINRTLDHQKYYDDHFL